MTRASPMAFPLLLIGCTGWPAGSYVRSISQADATVLAPAITDYLTTSLPARQDISLIQDGPNDPISPLLDIALEHAGFTQEARGQKVRYLAAPLDNGVLLRILVDDRTGGNRYFARLSDGSLHPAGPLTVATP